MMAYSEKWFGNQVRVKEIGKQVSAEVGRRAHDICELNFQADVADNLGRVEQVSEGVTGFVCGRAVKEEASFGFKII